VPASTSLEVDERSLSVWREDICNRALDADAPWSRGDRMAVRLDVAQLAGLVSLGIDVRAGNPMIARGRARLGAGDRPPAFGLSLVTHGAGAVDVGGRTLELRAGDLCLLDSSHAFRKRMGPGYGEVFLYCPYHLAHAALGDHLPSVAPQLAAPSTLSRLLADSLRSVRRHADALGDDELTPSLRAVLGLVAAVFCGTAAPSASTAVLWRERIRRHIDAHVHEPSLRPASIAADLHVSVRFVHRVFEECDSTVGATILGARLDRCHAQLLDPAHAHRSISEIAFALGFTSAAHFSRAFRARFGRSPRSSRGPRTRVTRS
jgi:AraC-like DNA-binding protein